MKGWLILALLPGLALADGLTARVTLRPGTVIGQGDVEGPARAVAAAIGQEVRRAVFAGRPVGSADLGPPTLVHRNAIVTMVYRHGPLAIRTEGRALEAGTEGARVRVLNLESRKPVTATVRGPALVEVTR